MNPLDYGRSFLIGRAPSNEVRFWVESRTRVTDEAAGLTEDYLQAASCKSEDTFAESDLFYADNYDFLPIFGPEYGVIFRRKAWLNPDYRSVVPTLGMWEGPEIHLVEAASWEELTTPAAILEATRAFRPIVAQTRFRDGATGLSALLEYPVKTLNTRRRDARYQIDTGPLAFPDLSRRPGRLVDTLGLAFIAFNAPHFCDVVIESPTPAVAPDRKATGAIPHVHHFGRRRSFSAENRLFALD